jgi:plasmid maintenance system antidote protein VapI
MPTKKIPLHKQVRARWVDILNDVINKGIENSYSSLAASIGIHTSQVNRLVRLVKENSDTKEAPTVEMIYNVCEKYKCSCEWVITGRGSMRLVESEHERLIRLETQIKQIQKIVSNR